MTLQGVTLYDKGGYRVDYNFLDSRLYIYKEDENGHVVYLGNRHIVDIIDITEQNHTKEEIVK